MRAFDLCAGCGGFSLGLTAAGFDTLGVEREPDAVATHVVQVGPCELDDITRWHPPHDADVVVGGVPCQPFSAAGARKGTGEERGTLYRDLVRIGAEANAKAIVIENVVGLTTWRDGGGANRGC